MPVKVEQINEYLFSDTVQSQKTERGSDEISQGQYREYPSNCSLGQVQTKVEKKNERGEFLVFCERESLLLLKHWVLWVMKHVPSCINLVAVVCLSPKSDALLSFCYRDLVSPSSGGMLGTINSAIDCQNLDVVK